MYALRFSRDYRASIGVLVGLTLCASSGVVWPTAFARAQGAQAGTSSTQSDQPTPPRQFPVTLPDPVSALSLPTNENLTPSDAAFDLRTNRSVAFWRTSPKAPSIASDSIRTAVESRGRAWLESLRVNAPDALHLDDAGRVHVVAGQDSVAQRIFTQRVTTPGLSVLDRAYTLHAAAVSFADTMIPSRLAVAEAYTKALDSLTAREARVYGFRAHLALAAAYDGLGRRALALQHALHAVRMLEHMPLFDREDVYADAAPFMIAAHALQDEPNGRQRLDSLREVLKVRAGAFSGMTVVDSVTLGDRALFWPDSAARISGSASLLGRPAPPIYAHFMMNVPGATSSRSTDSTAVALNDGTVRLVMFGNLYCCVDAMLSLQRLYASFPLGANALFVSATTGYLNGTLVTPDEEVAQTRSIFADTLKVTYPIAMWAGPKQRTASNGMVPSPSPNLAAYSISRGRYERYGGFSAPYLVIIDGKGIVRRIFSAQRGFTRDDQQRALTVIRELVAKKS